MPSKVKLLAATRFVKLGIKGALLLFLLLTLLNTKVSTATNNIEVNRNIGIETLKVITLAPHITELVYAAGAGHTIIATVNSSNYPRQAKQIPKIGDGLNINLEQIIALDPNIVYAWQENLSNHNLGNKLKPFDVKIFFSTPNVIEDIPTQIRLIGEQLKTSEQANAVAYRLESDIYELKNTYINKQKQKVFIEIGTKPFYTLGDDTLTNSVLNICGAKNAFADSFAVAPIVNPEQVLQADPDIIIITNLNAGHFKQRLLYWQRLGLRAAINNQVYTIDPDKFLRPGPRLISATRKICQLIDNARTTNMINMQK